MKNPHKTTSYTTLKDKAYSKKKNQVADRIVKITLIKSTNMQVFENILEKLLTALEISLLCSLI